MSIERLGMLEQGAEFRVFHFSARQVDAFPIGDVVYVKKDCHAEAENCLVLNVYTGRYDFKSFETPIVRTFL